jgi:FlaA1/EpsC-like NDP-sugar epimerase
MKKLLLDLPPSKRLVLLLVLYAVELTASLWIAYDLRFDFAVDAASCQERYFGLTWLVPLQLILLGVFHQLRPLLAYFSTPDLGRMFHALFVSAVIALLVWIFWGTGFAPPRGVIAMDFMFSLVGLTGIRLALRTVQESSTVPGKGSSRQRRRVVIFGAGDTGAVLAKELSLKASSSLFPVAFFDDDPGKWNSRVHDIPVLGPQELLPEAIRRLRIQEAIIAMPSAPAKRIGEIVRLLRSVNLPCKTVPSLDQLALGQVRVSQLRNVEIQDLLGREKVELETGNIRLALQDKVVLVTGAGGSIGSELCRQIASYHCKRLLLLDRSEPNLFQIEQELIRLDHGQRIVPLIGDILDLARMQEIFAKFHPEVIFHAAAHKHVPMMEHQPQEAIQNNSLGTAQLADLALEFGVERFTLISTDKAINPTNVMGATKRMAEIFVQALYAAHPGQTKFMAVRFGNVLGSSGSVIPVFSRQIAEGGPVKVTHPDMTRYFMTIPEASMLVLQSAAQGTGGEIFVLDMGRPMKIVDLARQMIELSGLKPGEDIQIEFTGIRPGEKLFEEITRQGENFAPTTHPKIFRFLSQPADLASFRQTLQSLRDNLHKLDAGELRGQLQKAIPEYRPSPGPDNRLVAAIAKPDEPRSGAVAGTEIRNRHLFVLPGKNPPKTAPLA